MAIRRRKKTTTRSKRRTVRRTKRTVRRTKRKTTSGKKSAKNIRISFKGLPVKAETIFGKKPLTPNAVAQKLWSYVNKKKLAYYK